MGGNKEKGKGKAYRIGSSIKVVAAKWLPTRRRQDDPSGPKSENQYLLLEESALFHPPTYNKNLKYDNARLTVSIYVRYNVLQFRVYITPTS